MKKINIYLTIMLLGLSSMLTAEASILTSSAEALSSWLHSNVFSNKAASTQPKAPTPVVIASAADQSGFPLPEGMTAAPAILSPILSSTITKVVSFQTTPSLLSKIAEPMPVIETPATMQMVTFSPVAPPTEISGVSVKALNANSTSHTLKSSKTKIEPDEAALRKAFIKHPFTGTFDITSLYVFRGISRSGNSLAFQGGYTYTFLNTGIYLKVWGSNVDFLSRQGQQATVEADTVAGIKNKIGKNFTYDLNMIRYNYPKASGANYNEFVSLLTYKILVFTLGYSPNAFNAHANGLYYSGGFDIPIPEKYTFQYTNVSVFGHYGHYSLSEDLDLRSYNDFLVGLQKVINSYSLQLFWKGTNNEAEQKGLDANRLVASVLVNF